MEKDFDVWNQMKKRIHSIHRPPYFAEREVWWCSLGVNIGHEEDGKHELFERPVLILKVFNQHLFFAVPMTSVVKFGAYYYRVEYGLVSYSFILSQARPLSTKRLLRKMYLLPNEEFQEIKRVFRDLIQ